MLYINHIFQQNFFKKIHRKEARLSLPEMWGRELRNWMKVVKTYKPPVISQFIRSMVDDTNNFVWEQMTTTLNMTISSQCMEMSNHYPLHPKLT